jgi:hypothetical protein
MRGRLHDAVSSPAEANNRVTIEQDRDCGSESRSSAKPERKRQTACARSLPELQPRSGEIH